MRFTAGPSLLPWFPSPKPRTPRARLVFTATSDTPACKGRVPTRYGRSAAAGVRLLDELCERALEVLEIKVEVDDLVNADRLRSHDRLDLSLGNLRLDFLNGSPGDSEHDDECHLALRARDLKVEALLLVAQDLHIAAFETASADRAVVEPRSVADELDDAHRRPILRRVNSGYLLPSMHVHPAGPTAAEWTVPAGSTILSPDFSSIVRPSPSSANVIDPSTQ